MYPVLFTIPGIDFPISTFGVMLAAGFLVGTWITGIRLGEEGYEPDATTLLIYVMLGGILGAKLYFAVDTHLRDGEPFASLLFARAGLTWYGGLLGGAALGAIGCFLVGDDYGGRTELPWGVRFPEGSPPTDVPVHPTQLYEVAWLLPVAALLWARRRRSPFLFGEYLALNGLGRLVIEHWRVNPRVALGLTEPQWIGIALVVAGVGGWIHYAR